MKILHVAPVFFPEGPGGIQVHVRDLAQAQIAAGDRVSILAGSLESRPEPVLEEQRAEGLRVLRLYRDDLHHVHHARGYHAGASRLIEGAFGSERPDVIHIHSWVALSTDLVATAERLGIPTVVTLHDFLASCPRAYRQDSSGQACLRPLGPDACGPCAPRFGFESEALVADSLELFQSSLRAELEQARARVLALPGIGRDLFRLAGLGDLEFEAIPLGYAPQLSGAGVAGAAAAGPVRFGTWGRLGPHKGTDLAVRGFVEACARLPTGAAELVVFGELAPDAYRAQVLGGSAGLPIEEFGPFDFADLQAARLDVALFPSRCLETFGFVLDEARELGLPMVLSDLGAYGERAAGDCLVVGGDGVDGWARAIARLVEDPTARQRLAAAAPQASPSPAAYARRLDETYQRAVESPPRRAGASAPDKQRWLSLRERYDAGLGR